MRGMTEGTCLDKDRLMKLRPQQWTGQSIGLLSKAILCVCVGAIVVGIAGSLANWPDQTFSEERYHADAVAAAPYMLAVVGGFVGFLIVQIAARLDQE